MTNMLNVVAKIGWNVTVRHCFNCLKEIQTSLKRTNALNICTWAVFPAIHLMTFKDVYCGVSIWFIWFSIRFSDIRKTASCGWKKTLINCHQAHCCLNHKAHRINLNSYLPSKSAAGKLLRLSHYSSQIICKSLTSISLFSTSLA